MSKDLFNEARIHSKGMKILVVINGWATKMSGGDYHILKVAKFWSKDHKISYLLPRLGYDYSKSFLRGKPLVYNSFLEKEMKNNLSIALLYIIRILKVLFNPPKENFDVVIASSHFLYDIIPAAYIALKNPSCKLVVYYHGMPAKRRKLLIKFGRRINDAISINIIRKQYDLVFAINIIIKDSLLRKGINIQKIKLTSNGIDKTITFTDSEEKEYNACFLGRLVEGKGIFDLVDVWKNVTNELNGKLIIIGDGPDKQKLMKRIKKEDLEEKIILAGYLNEEKYEILVKSKIFLFPSYKESWGIVIAEALSSGLPVITYDLPAYHEVFGDFIISVPMGDKVQMAEKAIFLLKNPKVRKKYSEAGKNFIKVYGWHNVSIKQLEYITNIN